MVEIGLWPWERHREDFEMEARIPKKENDEMDTFLQIVSPADGSTVSGTVTLNYFCWDTGGIKSLSFLVDGAVVETRSGNDFSKGLLPFSWKKPSKGAHVLTLNMVDQKGVTTTSSPVRVIVS